MVNENPTIREISAKISDAEYLRIKDFVQGAVYCYCKNCKGERFAARDLFGGDNYDWSSTPLQALYSWHEKNKSSDPVSMAGKDIGWILLDVLNSDGRKFIKHDGYTNEYEWVYELNK